MARRAWRVSYVTDSKTGDVVQGSTVYYGNDPADAWLYAGSLFKDNTGGQIKVDELAAFDVGVPGDVELAEIMRDIPTEDDDRVFDMRSPGNINA